MSIDLFKRFASLILTSVLLIFCQTIWTPFVEGQNVGRSILFRSERRAVYIHSEPSENSKTNFEYHRDNRTYQLFFLETRGAWIRVKYVEEARDLAVEGWVESDDIEAKKNETQGKIEEGKIDRQEKTKAEAKNLIKFEEEKKYTKTLSESAKQRKIVPYTVPYIVLKKWLPYEKMNNLGMDLLVSPHSSKEDVISLARYLWSNNQDKKLLIVNIFDSREAWKNRGNHKYPESKYWNHYLVNIFRNTDTSSERMLWVKENVDEAIPIVKLGE